MGLRDAPHLPHQQTQCLACPEMAATICGNMFPRARDLETLGEPHPRGLKTPHREVRRPIHCGDWAGTPAYVT